MRDNLIKKIIFLFLFLCSNAFAQNFPNRPVTIITSFSVGSGPEVLLRSIGDLLSKKWGQTVVIENKPGGKGYVAVNSLRLTKPDGYTLLQLDDIHLSQRDPYAIIDNVEPVAALLRSSFFIVVASDSTYKTINDVIAAGKIKNINYGSWGIGTPAHIGAEMIISRSNTKMSHVPYREMSQLYADVSNKEPAWAFGSPASTRSLYKSGRLKYLANSGTKRLPDFADIPTVAESGFPGFELYGYVSMYVPKGTPEDIVRKLNKDINEVIKDPALQRIYNDLFYETLVYDLSKVRKHVIDESKKVPKISQ